MSTVLHPIGSFTSLFLLYTGLPDCIGNSFQHHKQHRQNTRQAFSQPLSDSFFYYIFSFPLVLSIISSYSFSKVCILPKFCVLEKLVTCGVIRSYSMEALQPQNVCLFRWLFVRVWGAPPPKEKQTAKWHFQFEPFCQSLLWLTRCHVSKSVWPFRGYQPAFSEP